MTRVPGFAVTILLAALLGRSLPAQGPAIVERPQEPPSRRREVRPAAAVGQGVFAAAARGGRVRVIVGVAVPFAAEGILPSAERAVQRADIAAAQSRIAAALTGFQ